MDEQMACQCLFIHVRKLWEGYGRGVGMVCLLLPKLKPTRPANCWTIETSSKWQKSYTPPKRSSQNMGTWKFCRCFVEANHCLVSHHRPNKKKCASWSASLRSWRFVTFQHGRWSKQDPTVWDLYISLFFLWTQFSKIEVFRSVGTELDKRMEKEALP